MNTQILVSILPCITLVLYNYIYIHSASPNLHREIDTLCFDNDVIFLLFPHHIDALNVLDKFTRVIVFDRREWLI